MAMKVFNVGDVLAAADVNEYLVNTRVAVKGADTTRSSNTTLSNDPDLSVAIDASKTYWLEAMIGIQSPVAAGFRFQFTAPAGIAFTGIYQAALAAATSSVVFDGSGNLITSIFSIGTDGAGIEDVLMFRGVLVVAGTGGNLTFQWSQTTSNATSTIVRKN